MAAPEGGFFEGLVDRLGNLLGDRAGRAALEYAAFSEGKRVASGYGAGQMRQLLDRLDAMLGQHTTVVDEGPPWILHVRESRLLEEEHGLLAGICLAVLSGACGDLHGKTCEAKLMDRLSDGTHVVEVGDA